MADTPYAHLHVHTEYSMLDGAARLKELFKEVTAQGMTHVAMTDHGNMFGAAEFHRQAKEAGITPVIGIEAYVAPEHRGNKNRILWGQPHQKQRRRLRLRLLPAQDDLGPEQRGPAQPLQAHQPLLRRGLADQVGPDGQGDHRRALGRPDGLHRLPERRAADAAAPRPGGGGAPGRRRVPGHLRQGELLPRADGPRPGHRAPGPRRACSRSARSSASRRWSPTTPTTARSPTPRRTSSCCASRPARPSPTPTGSSSTAPATTSSRRPRCTRSAPTTSGARAAATPSCWSPTGSTRRACSSSST